MNSGGYDKLSVIVLVGTLLIVCWYTVETHLMKDAIKDQVDISVRPCLAITKSDSDSSFKICNIGNGVAVNIRVEDLILGSDLGFMLTFNKTLYLKPGQEEVIEITTRRKEGVSSIPLDAHLDAKYSNKQYSISIQFEDMMHRKYQQELSLGKDGAFIGEIKKIALRS